MLAAAVWLLEMADALPDDNLVLRPGGVGARP